MKKKKDCNFCRTGNKPTTQNTTQKQCNSRKSAKSNKNGDATQTQTHTHTKNGQNSKE